MNSNLKSGETAFYGDEDDTIMAVEAIRDTGQCMVLFFYYVAVTKISA